MGAAKKEAAKKSDSATESDNPKTDANRLPSHRSMASSGNDAQDKLDEYNVMGILNLDGPHHVGAAAKPQRRLVCSGYERPEQKIDGVVLAPLFVLMLVVGFISRQFLCRSIRSLPAK